MKKIRQLNTLHSGQQVRTVDGQVWEIVSLSSTTPHTPARAKWCWLRRGNTYRQIRGTAGLLALRLIEEAMP
jgi:hypothetical protein